jgi:hypothetical protein
MTATQAGTYPDRHRHRFQVDVWTAVGWAPERAVEHERWMLARLASRLGKNRLAVEYVGDQPEPDADSWWESLTLDERREVFSNKKGNK